MNSRRALDRLLHSGTMDNLRVALAETIRKLPPLFFFVDGIDNVFDRAPREWTLCQRGLLDAVHRLLPDSSLGGKLHVSVTLRDVVWSAARDSEHALRRADMTYIRVLHWNRPAIEYFLARKIQSLHPKWFARLDEDGRTLSGWLGTATITPAQSKPEESIVTFLLRHTRLAPRDIVFVCNRLCDQLQDNHRRSADTMSAKIREIVMECTRLIGNEQLMTCATELVSRMIPAGFPRHAYGVYIDNSDFSREVNQSLKAWLRESISVDRFPHAILVQAHKAWVEAHSDKYELEHNILMETLWRNQLLGCRMEVGGRDRDVFFSDAELGTEVPRVDEYVLHPILHEAAGVRQQDVRPVIPWFR